MLDDTINKNESLKIPDTLEILEFSETPKSYKCKLCRKSKNLESYHKFEIKIDNHVLGEEHFTGICIDCISKECLVWDIYNRKIGVNRSKFNAYFLNKQKQLFFEKHNISIDTLIHRSKALEILNKTNKNWIKDKVQTGILKEYSFIIGTTNFTEHQNGFIRLIEQKYYIPEQIETLKYIIQNGQLKIRTKPSIKNGAEFIHNPPFTILGRKNYQYLFSNNTEQKRVCARCLEYKGFDKFYKRNVATNVEWVCIDCHTQASNKRYKNMPQDVKKEHIRKVREWCKANKDKIRLYKKNKKKIKRTKTLSERVRNKLKRRLKKVVESANSQPWREWITKQTNKSYFETNMLGITTLEFIKYIESKWLPGMNWDNYGNSGYEKDENDNYIYENEILKKKIGWEIDHIKALSSFNLKDPEEVKKANYYTNLLPMWWEDNNAKSNKTELSEEFDKEFLEKYKELEILIKKKDNKSYGNKNMLEMQDGEEFARI